MITNLHAKINRISNGKSLIFLLALSLLLMVGINTINLPISVPRINELSHGVSILDLKTYYTSTEANQVIETLNPIFTWLSLFLIVLGLIRIFLVNLRSKG